MAAEEEGRPGNRVGVRVWSRDGSWLEKEGMKIGRGAEANSGETEVRRKRGRFGMVETSWF